MDGMRNVVTPKRYSVRDENGDELSSWDVWTHAALELRLWGGTGSIFDREEGETVQTMKGTH